MTHAGELWVRRRRRRRREKGTETYNIYFYLCALFRIPCARKLRPYDDESSMIKINPRPSSTSVWREKRGKHSNNNVMKEAHKRFSFFFLLKCKNPINAAPNEFLILLVNGEFFVRSETKSEKKRMARILWCSSLCAWCKVALWLSLTHFDGNLEKWLWARDRMNASHTITKCTFHSLCSANFKVSCSCKWKSACNCMHQEKQGGRQRTRERDSQK